MFKYQTQISEILTDPESFGLFFSLSSRVLVGAGGEVNFSKKTTESFGQIQNVKVLNSNFWPKSYLPFQQLLPQASAFFSRAGLSMSPRRSRLQEHTLEMLTFLQCNLRLVPVPKPVAESVAISLRK